MRRAMAIIAGLTVIGAWGCAPSMDSASGARDFAARLSEPSCQKIADSANAQQALELVASDPMSRVPSTFTTGVVVPLDKVKVMPDYSAWRDAACQYALGQMDSQTHQEWEERYAQMRDVEHATDAEAAYDKAKTMAHDPRFKSRDTMTDPSLEDDRKLKEKYGAQ